MTNDMATQLSIFHGKTAKEIIKQIGEWELISMSSHALDLGAELQKAEIALNYDLHDWKQDRRIEIKVPQTEVENSKPQEKIDAPTRYVRKGKKVIPLK